MTRPWSAKQFFYQDRETGENVSALLIRLPVGSATQPGGYWALSMNALYGNCKLEYITKPAKLLNDYQFRGPTHPMIGNPCSRTVYDPLKLTNLPGSAWVRGGIVQGSHLRPPLGIELGSGRGRSSPWAWKSPLSEDLRRSVNRQQRVRSPSPAL